MGNNQSLAMKHNSDSNCLHLKVGGEYVHNPLQPLHVFFRQIRMIMVDKYGAHLKHLRILRYIQPHPMLNPSGCIFVPYTHQQHKIIRFSGHLIPDLQNKTLKKTNVPKFILSKSPILHENKSNITNVSGINPSGINVEEIVYKVNIMQNDTEPGLRYFGTIGSKFSISRIGLFDEEMILKSGDSRYQDFMLQNNTEKHILLNAIQSEKYKRADPIINLKVSSILSYLNPENDKIQITISALQQHHFYERHSKTCIINKMNEECLFMIYSGNDHHIFIENHNGYPHHINMSFETSHKKVHPEAITVFNHHNLTHHHRHNHNIFASILFALGIVLGFISLVAMVLRCYRRKSNNNDDRSRLQGLISNKRSFFNHVIPRKVIDEYETESSSI